MLLDDKFWKYEATAVFKAQKIGETENIIFLTLSLIFENILKTSERLIILIFLWHLVNNKNIRTRT